MKKMKTWHKYALILSVLLAITSWVIAILYWGEIYGSIPAHLGIGGQPNTWQDKQLFSIMLLPMVQTLMLGLFVFLYAKPQYSDMPTTLWLTTLAPEKRDHSFGLIRTMLAGTSIWVGVLFTYIVYISEEAALQEGTSMNEYVMFAIVGGMLTWLLWWTIKVYRATRLAIAGAKKKE